MSESLNKVEVVEDKIIFEFLDDINNKTFSDVTSSGIIIQESAHNQLEKPRLAKVLKTGPDVNYVNLGDTVLIEPLKWTTAIEIDEVDHKFWITDEKSILAISE